MERNADEIVRALKACGTGKAACEKCPFRHETDDMECHFTKASIAADLIDSLRSQLAEIGITIAAEGFSDLATMIAKYKTVMLAANETSISQDEEREELREQLKISKRNTRDARNELCLKCGRYREAHNGACDWCRWKEAAK